MSQKFIGQPHDNGTGLDYFGARFYSASLGRFTSPDQVILTSRRMAQPHLLNLYAYANNNPLSYTDPTGMDAGPIYNPIADASDPFTPIWGPSSGSSLNELVNYYGIDPKIAAQILGAIPWSQVNQSLVNYQSDLAYFYKKAADTNRQSQEQIPTQEVKTEVTIRVTFDPPDMSIANDPLFQLCEGMHMMYKNYDRMKDANWVGSDHYYHCMGNCQATNYGLGGALAAKIISFFRTNISSRYFFEKDDWMEDDIANRCGQQCGNCASICAPFIPPSSPGKPPFPGW